MGGCVFFFRLVLFSRRTSYFEMRVTYAVKCRFGRLNFFSTYMGNARMYWGYPRKIFPSVIDTGCVFSDRFPILESNSLFKSFRKLPERPSIRYAVTSTPFDVNVYLAPDPHYF